MTEKRCQNCGLLMVKRRGSSLVSTVPARQRFSWWCGCGHEEAGGIERVSSGEELLARMWRQKNLGQRGVAGRMARWKMEGGPL